MQYEGETFERKTLVLDGNVFLNCTLQDCQLIYRGGIPPVLSGNAVHACSWTFEEAAGNTLQLLKTLVADNDDFRRMIRENLAL